MKHKWIIPEREKNISLEDSLLIRRGIITSEDKVEFLSDKPILTYDPFAMKDMEEGARKILDAIENDKHICIYGDYDCDGVCSISLLLYILQRLSAKVSYYIPSRIEEGYGLNMDAIDSIRNRNADVIVTVDCGSVSYNEVEYAKSLGLDIIVTDHHNLNQKAADCLLINPKQENCSYPEQELSGCGVAFKLAQALKRLSHKSITKSDLNRVLDLVAIATIGDIVPLVGENRTMVKYGLREINRMRRPGLKRLIEMVGLKPGEIKAEHVAYVIVPHINAAGRLSSADIGVNLLTSCDEKEINSSVSLLIENNMRRREVQEEAYAKAIELVESKYKNELFLLLNIPDIHEGIAGIVAGKIKDCYHRPTIIVTPSNNELKGTGRSIDGIDLYELLHEVNHLFIKFGGHSGACGFLLDTSNLDELRKFLMQKAGLIKKTNEQIFIRKLYIDEVVTIQECNRGLLNILERMEPFGYKNLKPLLCVRNVFPENPVYVGDKKQHVRFSVSGLSFVLFKRADDFRILYEKGVPIDIAGWLELNSWNGSEKIQFVATDLKCYNE